MKKCVPPPAPARHPLDAAAAAPSNHIVLLENENVRVLETRLAAGERTPLHVHEWPAALYILSWSDFVRRDSAGEIVADSRTAVFRPGPGTALWSPPHEPQSIENIGGADLHLIAVEVKRA